MKLSIVVNATPKATPLAADIPLDEALGLAAEVGFSGVELAIGDPKSLDVASLKRLLAAHSLEVPAIGTGAAYAEGFSLSHPDAARREGAVSRLKAHVDLAEQLGALVIVGLIRGRARDGLGEERATECALSGMREVAEYAEVRGVRLLLEPMNRFETDIWNTVEDALAVARASGENVGLLVDTFHMNIEEPSITRSLREAAPRIWHVHVADSNRWAPGYGHLDFREIVGTLRETGYESYLSAEILHKPDIRSAYARTREHLAPLLWTPGPAAGWATPGNR
ncbi:MAG: sugar phosphate isomerase/epimerase [Firmicutes bacterium]|nr:sugar phosphate isomerase/epimerase [Bacillota bacterium]MDH7494728.1 sugar phosphate isomerase/epimerase family protein [Bacillota bacterium]